ncbi:MAG: hypothetical protein MUD15_06240 [Desulfobacterota bacterium]|nr:hypothetical protein [Thermodesulfobacteriota bacterium]
MKRNLFFAVIITGLFLSYGSVFAQIYNQTCQSAEYARTLNRNASTDATDIVVYNPAGLTDLSDGFHINVSNQVWVRRPSHTFDDPLGDGQLTFEQEGTDWFIPNLHAAFKQGNWSVFGAVYIPGGGASVDYPDGSFSTRALGAGIIGPGGPFENIYNGISDEYLKGSSLYLAVSIGGAYRLSKTISVAGGIRSLSVANSIEGSLTLTDGLLGPLTQDVPLKVDVKETGQGWGGVVGIQVKPVDGLNVALHCETPIKLRLETDIREGDNISEEAGLFMDGQKNRRDFPAMIGLGASYRFIPEFRSEVNFNYWFQKAADWGKAQNGDDMSNLAGDSWSIGTACAYMLTPRLEISSGVLYTWYDFGDIDEYYSNSLGAIEVFYADDVMYSVGFGYEVVTGLTLNFGIGWIFYKSETVKTPQGEVKMSNTSSSAMALGVDYSF